MTPLGIKLGRQFDSFAKYYELGVDDEVEVAPADANRVALSIAVYYATLATWDAVCPIYTIIGTSSIPLSALTPGHPACYLSVDKIGSALFGRIFIGNFTGNATIYGVTIVRQVQELPK